MRSFKTFTIFRYECARYLIKEIELILPRSYIDCNIIKLMLKKIRMKLDAIYKCNLPSHQ